jgi:hypothetical protein
MVTGGSSVQKVITDDMDAMLDILPPHIKKPLVQQEYISELVEVVIDLGRTAEARFPRREVVLDEREIEEADIDYIVARVGAFGEDNRAGIERTLATASPPSATGAGCIVWPDLPGGPRRLRHHQGHRGPGHVRQERAAAGRPGVARRPCCARWPRFPGRRRPQALIIVDTSNEIAGDGDIPHPAIGHARRMQVATPISSTR